MAKKAKSPEEIAAKKAASIERAKKYDAPEDKTVTLNVAKVGKETVTTLAEPIRGLGVRVTEVYSGGGISTTFIKGAKIKKKKAWLYLVMEKEKEEKKDKKK